MPRESRKWRNRPLLGCGRFRTRGGSPGSRVSAGHSNAEPRPAGDARMTWTKLSDTFLGDPVFLRIRNGHGDSNALITYLELTVWSNSQETDGEIPADLAYRITNDPDPAWCIDELVRVGLLARTDDGWLLVRFADEQRSSATVKSEREKSRRRMERSRKHQSGDHSECDARWCTALRADYSLAGNGIANRQRNANARPWDDRMPFVDLTNNYIDDDETEDVTT